MLQGLVEIEKELIQKWFFEPGEQNQYFTGPMDYQAQFVDKATECLCQGRKNTPMQEYSLFLLEHMPEQTAKEIYMDFNFMRGDLCEKRIKEVKSMCVTTQPQENLIQ